MSVVVGTYAADAGGAGVVIFRFPLEYPSVFDSILAGFGVECAKSAGNNG